MLVELVEWEGFMHTPEKGRERALAGARPCPGEEFSNVLIKGEYTDGFVKGA